MREKQLQKGVEMIKLKYGNGSITKRQRLNKNGTIYTWYQARYYDEYGIQRSISAKTQKLCLEKLKDTTSLTNKKKNKAKSQNLYDWINTYYKTYKEPFIKESTKESYTICIKKHIPEELKIKSLSKITVTDIQNTINNIKQERQKQITAQLLKSVMKTAFDNGYTKIKGWENIKIPKHKAKEKNILTYNQEKEVLKLLNKDMQNIVIAYLNTGCRLNELRNIKESDIDRNKKLIIIRGTKTENSYRIIPLLPIVEDKIPIANLSDRTIQKYFKNACNKLNIKVTIHDLRHTFATRCLESGVNMKTVQKWLGHSTYQLTADTYSHITPDFEQSEVQKLLHKLP